MISRFLGKKLKLLCKALPVFYWDLPCLCSALKAERSLGLQVVLGDAQPRFPSHSSRCVSWTGAGTWDSAGEGRTLLVLNSLLLTPGIHSPQPHSCTSRAPNHLLLLTVP